MLRLRSPQARLRRGRLGHLRDRRFCARTGPGCRVGTALEGKPSRDLSALAHPEAIDALSAKIAAP